ncbi:MAG: AtpZ/AtpI family protein [Candidatus Aminicenantes bacterium]|nr:MAG: AtpZ/AtpI family protein [Candidatus Aminicenantes bacterium]
MAKEDKRKLAAYSTVGLMFPVSIAIGVAIGYFLDKWLNTSPYLLVIFALYGVAAGFWNLFKVTKKYDDRKKNQFPNS